MRINKFSLIINFMFLFATFLLADDEGLNNYRNKKFEEAKKYYEQILSVRENDPAASLGLGCKSISIR